MGCQTSSTRCQGAKYEIGRSTRKPVKANRPKIDESAGALLASSSKDAVRHTRNAVEDLEKGNQGQDFGDHDGDLGIIVENDCPLVAEDKEHRAIDLLGFKLNGSRLAYLHMAPTNSATTHATRLATRARIEFCSPSRLPILIIWSDDGHTSTKARTGQMQRQRSRTVLDRLC